MPETPVQPKATSKKVTWLKTILIIEIIVIVVGLFAGAYMYFVNNKSDKESTQTAPPEEETTEKPDVETADWKTYKNTAVRFQFSYPPRFSNPKINKANFPDATGVEDNVTIIIGDNSEQGFLLVIVPHKTRITLDDLFNGYLVLIPEENKKFFEKEKLVINGFEALKVSLNDRIVNVFFLTSTHSINLSMPLDTTAATADEVETIISSFKPLD